MYKHLFWLIAFAQTGFSQELFSNPNRYWNFHNWAAVGYRYDRQHFNEFSGNSSSLNSKLSIFSRSSPFLTIGNHTEFKNLLLVTRGSYGWLGFGRVDFDLPGNYGAEPLNFGKLKDDAGYSAEALASLSYVFNFTQPLSNFTFSFIPGVGYTYFHLMDYPSDVHTITIPSGAYSLSAGTTGFANAIFTHAMQQDWFGPFVEGRLLFRFMQKTQLEFFYQYHLPDLRMVNRYEIDTYLFNPSSTLTRVQLDSYHNIVHGNALRSHLGGFDLRYHGSGSLTFGLHFEGTSTWSHTNRYYVRQTQQQFIDNPGTTVSISRNRMAIHWVNYMAYSFIGYQF